jgi:dolichol kinase
VTNPWLGIALLLGVDAALLVSIYLVGRFGSFPGEVNRKLIHLSTTIVSLPFPWVFRDVWPACVLAGVAVALMGLARAPALQGLVKGYNVGESLRRDAWGEFYYPVSIALLFAATRGAPLDYVVLLCAIGFGDAAAAVIGKAYGRLRYRTAGRETKSVEGSLAFLFVAFACGWAALGLQSGLSAGDAGLLALTASVYMALLEAIAWHGMDNLLAPFGGLLVLRALARVSPDALLVQASLATAAAVFLTVRLFPPWPAFRPA